MISLLGILQWLRLDPELLLESADGLELFGGATVYFNKAQRWHFAALAFYETHSEKGVACDAQWKLTFDDLGLDIPVGRNRIFALGPLEHALLQRRRASHPSRLFQSRA